MQAKDFLKNMASVEKTASPWKPNAINIGAGVGGAIFGAIENQQRIKDEKVTENYQKQVDTLKGRVAGEHSTVLDKAQLFIEEAKLKTEKFRKNNPTLSTILNALVTGGTGYATGTAVYAGLQAAEQHLPPNRRKFASAEQEKTAGPAMDALSHAFGENLPAVAGGAYGAVRGAYESPDHDLRLLASILPALLTAGGAQLGSEVGGIGGEMVGKLFSNPSDLVTVSRLMGGVSGGSAGYRFASMINEMLIPQNKGRSPSQVHSDVMREKSAECYDIEDARLLYGIKKKRKDNEHLGEGPTGLSTPRDTEGRLSSNEGKQYIIVFDKDHVKQAASYENLQSALHPRNIDVAEYAPNYAYNYAQHPAAQQIGGSLSAPKKDEEGGAWSTIKKYLPHAAVATAGGMAAILGHGAWKRWDQRVGNMRELAQHLHGAAPGAEREVLRKLQQGERDAVHALSRNLSPQEVEHLRHFDLPTKPSDVSHADELVSQIRQSMYNRANPPQPAQPAQGA